MEKSTKNFLAIDQATTTGYAISVKGKLVESNAITFKRATRHIDLIKFIEEKVKAYKIDYILAEDIYKNKDQRLISAFEVLAELRGCVIAASQKLKVDLKFIKPITVKQCMWGMRYGCTYTREQQKERMIRAIERRGYTLNSGKDDEADAIGILLTCIE